jgi:protein-tyrosine phosphatase
MNFPTPPKSILAVCLGNICRSPTMEAVLRSKAARVGLALEVDSAGTAGYHVGSPPDHRAVRHGAQRRYDLTGLRARTVCAQDFERFDLILAADGANLRDLRKICPSQHLHKLHLFLGNDPLPDPYHGDSSDFDHVLDLVEERVETLLRVWQQSPP